MAVLCAAPVPRVDVLLRILPGEVAVVVRLPQVLGARLAGMTILHVETTGITRIPVYISFHEVRVWWGLNLLCLGRRRIISSACGRRWSHVPWCPRRRDRCDGGCTSCIECGWAAAITSSTPSSLSAAATLVGASESVGGKWGRRWKSVGGKCGRRLRRTASLSSDATSCVPPIERKSGHLFHHSMLILME